MIYYKGIIIEFNILFFCFICAYIYVLPCQKMHIFLYIL